MATNKVIMAKRTVTNLLIQNFGIMELGYDFMGYKVVRREDLSFHHMIYSRDQSKKMGLEHSGFLYWNGAILVRDTAHDYLHIVERRDRFKFEIITAHMIAMNEKGFLDKINLKEIDECLTAFEKEHADDITSKDKQLIRTRWISDRIKFD